MLDLIDQARQRGEVKGKRNDLVYNVHDVAESPDGNSTEFALRRLRKDRPDLHQRVIMGLVFLLLSKMPISGSNFP